jgi:hypothetical protein
VVSVVANPPGGGTPTGTVTVSDGTGGTCMITLPATSCNLTSTSPGMKTITATYPGDANYNGSSDTESHQVNKADVTVSITSDTPDPSAVGQNVTVNFTVVAAAPGAGTPTGNVTVSDGVNSCIATVAAGSCTLAFTTPGTRTITATYAGDPNFNGGTGTDSHNVVAPPTITKAFPAGTAALNSTITLTFTITNPAANTVPLTGVGFTDNFPNAPNMVVAAPLTVTNTCGGTLQNNFGGVLAANDLGIRLTGVTLGVSSTCMVTVNVTPKAAGSYNNTITDITSSNGGAGVNSTATVQVNCPQITLSPDSPLPNGEAGTPYTQTLTVTPAGSYTFLLLTGNLPIGLTLNTTSGVISGLPTVVGVYNFSVKVLGPGGCNVTKPYTITIVCPTMLTLSPASLPNGTVGTAYSQTVSATPIGGNYNYTVAPGTLPPGLNLHQKNGTLTGTPTTVGTFNFRLTATGWGGCSNFRDYTIVITYSGGGSCPTITLPASLANGTVGSPYSQSVAATPADSYTYTLMGSPPPGVTFYNAAALLYGYPTAPGSSTFTITATKNGCSASQTYTVIIGGATFASAVVGDYDGDGRTDFVTWSAEDRDWLILRSSDDQLQAAGWGANSDPSDDLLTAGDYDGDRKYDLSIFRRSTGEWMIQRSSDGVMEVERWNAGTPVPADYDGDGRTDIAVWQSASGKWSIKRSSDGAEETAFWGTVSAPDLDLPVVGDYDGDGKADLGVFRRLSNHWQIRLSSDGMVIDREWGVKGDLPVAADYDGDGKTDLAVWRASDGISLVICSDDGRERGFAMDDASRGEVPLLGDYDGDGKADLAVWRMADGAWRIKLSSERDEQRRNLDLKFIIPARKLRR